MSDIKDIEKTSLEAHVSLCELRYQALERRITEVEGKLDEVKTLIQDIHNRLSQVKDQTLTRWDKAQAGVIALLIAVVAFLLPTYLAQ